MTVRLLLTACLAALGLAGPAQAAAGARPDPSFGGGRGYVTTTVRGTTSLAYGVAAGPKGTTVVAGQASTPSGNGQALVASYLAKGTLDPRFATGGIFRTSLPVKDAPFVAIAIVREPKTGRWLVAGGYGQGSILLLRLTPAGRLDRSFGGARRGYAVVSVGGIGQAIALQRDGRILVGASNANANGRPMIVARFTRDGVLDRGYGTRGVAQALFWDADLASSAGVTSLAVAADGGVVASSHIDDIGGDGHGSAGVVKLSPSGRPDTAFGVAGHVEVAFTTPAGGFGQWFPCAMTADGRGRLTVTGDGSVAGGASALLSSRLTAAGALDPAFGTGGRSVAPGLRNDSTTTCGAVGGPGGVTTAGVASFLAQITAAGAPDTRFAPGGLLRIRRPGGVDVNAVVRPAKGRVVAAGSAGDALYVARFVG